MITGALVATDRRTSGIVVEDNASEFRIGNRIGSRFGTQAHVNVHSFNRIVLLTGEVFNDEVRKGVEDIAASSENVRSVVNQTVVAPTSSLSDRAADTLLADRIRAKFIGDGHVPANAVSTIVERHEVFLMGLVTAKEGDALAAIASATSGVERVVKVFEYIDPAAAAALSPPAPDAAAKPAGQ
jgi:osmotically-inducible protein OsmY